MPFVMEYDPRLLEALSRLPNTAKTQSAEEQGRDALTKPDGNGSITEHHHEGSDSGSPLKSPAKGTDGGANAKGSGGEKKRKRRSKNWSDEETEILLKAVSQKQKTKSRFSSEPWWDVIAKEVPGRTGDECQGRMETLIKSYNAIKDYCDNHKKEFKELKEEDLRAMKLATQLTETWYNRIRDNCPPRSNKRTRYQGAGSLTVNVPVVGASSSGISGEVGPVPAGFHDSGAESTDVIQTPKPVTLSKPPLEASGVVRNGKKTSETWNRGLGELLIDDSGRRDDMELGLSWGYYPGVDATGDFQQRKMHGEWKQLKAAASVKYLWLIIACY